MQAESLKVSPYNSTFDKEEFNYKHNFYIQLIDVHINCAGRMIGAHKFILANRSPFFKDIIKSDPRADIIDVGISYEMAALTLSIIYGETVTVKETEIAEFTRASSLLKVSFIARFPGDIDENLLNTVSSGQFPSEVVVFPITSSTSSSTSDFHHTFFFHQKLDRASSLPPSVEMSL